MVKKTFKRTILIYFVAVFVVFTVSILLFQQNREKRFKIEQLENTLEDISGIAHNFIKYYGLYEKNDFSRADTLIYLISQPDIRITVINMNGVVLYDNFVEDYINMENHLTRPEIQKALYSETGSNIRRSSTTNQMFYYYAHYYDNYFVRTAVVYNLEIKNFLKADRFFYFFIIIVFFIIWGIINYMTKYLSISITKLKDFAIKAGKNEKIPDNVGFPNNELGEIGTQIIKIYNNLKNTKDDLAIEKERLFNHLNILNEGISFFSPKKKKILSNSHFIQYVGIISNESTISAEHIFTIPELQKINEFLDEIFNSQNISQINELPQIEFTINKNELYFKILCIVFADMSFEILIRDITKPEKRRILKQELTSNIAHELKTPLASILGYLETIMNNKNIEKEKQEYFIQRTFAQAERLNLLLNDISLLNKIEEAGERFEMKAINLKQIVLQVIENLANRLEEKKIKCNVELSNKIIINGNDSLLFSIFQNLIENSINYAGKKISIDIVNYLEDDKYLYFSYSDTGSGIPEEHLLRIFERFYRVDSGRTREQGGTGLGLAIVRNAVQLHKGKISARNKPDGGLEFLFTLSKK